MSHDLPPIGQILPADANLRDCCHFAFVSVIAGSDLKAGDRVRYDSVTGKATRSITQSHGIIDPYLTNIVKKGQKVLLFLNPGTVTGMRHFWIHPDFPEGAAPITPTTLKSASEVWMRKWAITHMSHDYYGEPYTPLSDQTAYERAIEAGKTNYVGPYEDAGDHIDDTWWTHWEILTGGKGDRESGFRCGC